MSTTYNFQSMELRDMNSSSQPLSGEELQHQALSFCKEKMKLHKIEAEGVLGGVKTHFAHKQLDERIQEWMKQNKAAWDIQFPSDRNQQFKIKGEEVDTKRTKKRGEHNKLIFSIKTVHESKLMESLKLTDDELADFARSLQKSSVLRSFLRDFRIIENDVILEHWGTYQDEDYSTVLT